MSAVSQLPLPTLVFGVAARGGNGYRGDSQRTGMKKGSEVYQEALRIVGKCKKISQAKGRTLEVSAIVAIHGEQDTTYGTTRDDYARALTTWQQTLTPDITSITSQAIAPVFYVTQTNRATGGSGSNIETAIPNAQLDAQKINPNIVTVGPVYHAKPSSDNVHPSAAGYRKIGLMIGRAITDDLFRGYYSALYAKRAYFSADKNITVEFNKNIVIDNSSAIVSTIANCGISYTDHTSSPPSITSVRASGRHLIVSLDRAPVGISHAIHIASQHTGQNSYRTDGARSNIRTSDVLVTDRIDGEPVYLWACQQSVYF